MSTQNSVLIIGAGIGGLALAQGLKKYGIPFHVYESDPTPLFRPQGYRFRVSGGGADALRDVLPEHLFERFERVCATTMPGLTKMNALHGKIEVDVLRSLPNGPPGTRPDELKSYTADRTVTRDLLLTGLENNISFGKRLLRYEIGEDNAVVALFVDGSSAQGRLLVGAEGVRSVVRKQHLPNHMVLDTNCRCIFGKTKITDAFLSSCNKDVLKNMSLLYDKSREEPLTIFLEPIRFQDNDLRANLPDDYVYWVLVSDLSNFKNIPDKELFNLSSAEAADLSLALTCSWDPSLKAILEMQDRDITSALKIGVASPATMHWKSSANVTLLGDSVHVMPPTGAMGANTAFQDAAALLHALKKGFSLDSISEYDEGLQARGSEAIKQSVMGAKHILGMRDIETLQPMVL